MKGKTMKYTDYFPVTQHVDGEISMDEFIAEATRKDLKFETDIDKLKYMETSRVTLINELFTCYEFLKERNMLQQYKKYRDGE